MRLSASSVGSKTTIILIVSLFCLGEAVAQSSQYKRNEAPKVASPKKGAKKAGAATKKPKSATNQKLNLDDLEKRYWAPKDTEFKVVQNRKFKKEGRYNVTLMAGVLFNDPFIKGGNLSLSTAYYFNEHNGIELRYEKYDHQLGEGASSVVDKGGNPDVNFEKWFFGANYTWIPFYGKISVLDSSIIYFDMALSAGLGILEYVQTSKVAAVIETKTTPALSLDVSQQFFLNKSLAIRLDMRTKIYREDRRFFESGAELGTKTQVNTYVLLGATYFFN